MEFNYYQKYLKYKNKYLKEINKLYGGKISKKSTKNDTIISVFDKKIKRFFKVQINIIRIRHGEETIYNFYYGFEYIFTEVDRKKKESKIFIHNFKDLNAGFSDEKFNKDPNFYGIFKHKINITDKEFIFLSGEYQVKVFTNNKISYKLSDNEPNEYDEYNNIKHTPTTNIDYNIYYCKLIKHKQTHIQTL